VSVDKRVAADKRVATDKRVIAEKRVAVDTSQPEDVDLDRTDRLPILEGTFVDEDVEDDAVRLEYTASIPAFKSEFSRTSGVDLPALAESLRSVEERFARQSADYEALTRSYEKARDGETAAVARSHALAADLAGLRAMLDTEQNRSREMDRALAEKVTAAEGARARIEEALRDAQRHQGESHTLRDTLAARDATIVQVLHSLGERDAQLTALQREHAQIVPALEERSRTGAQFEADLRVARTRSEAMAAELKQTQQSAAALTAQLKARDVELGSTRHELDALRSQASSHLEKLRTREWRQGFDQNLFRELDAQIGAAQKGRGVLQSERDQLVQRISTDEAKLVARDEAIAKLKAAAAAEEALREKHEQERRAMDLAHADLTEKLAAMESERSRLNDVLATQHESIAKLKAAAANDEVQRNKHEQDLQNLDGARAALVGQMTALESERTRLNAELAVRDRAIDEARAAAANEAERFNDSLSTAERVRADLSDRVQLLESEAKAHDEEMGVLVAHLHEARRPIQAIEAEVKRLTEELAAKTLTLEALTEDNRSLRLAVERTRGALEEREFLIRRLERSESNNANVLGRIQTSIERLGVPAGTVINPGASLPVECSAELARIDGQHNTAHPLARRTRIGRAPGCELQIDSSSVSRHHALVLMGQRDVIIEDLNSTNGVLVNGRRISRQPLNDGDMLTIGEAQFRFTLNPAPRVLEAPASDPPAGA
jgi:chromosome segregation ATPase